MLALADPLGRRTGHGFLCHRLTVVVLIGLALVWRAHNVTAATQDRSQADRARVNLELVEAAGKGNVQAVRTLLSDGADVNAKNTFGTTALMAAADRGDLEVVKAILAAGADVNAKNHYGLTALMLAVHEAPIVRLLLEKGADVNARDSDGSTALMMAGQWTPEVLKLILAKGARVDEKNKKGSTALMAAAYHSLLERVKILLENGADVNARDRTGRTALDYAEAAMEDFDPDESGKVVELLKSRGAKGSKAGGGYEKLGIEFKEHWGNGREGSRIYPQAE